MGSTPKEFRSNQEDISTLKNTELDETGNSASERRSAGAAHKLEIEARTSYHKSQEEIPLNSLAGHLLRRLEQINYTCGSTDSNSHIGLSDNKSSIATGASKKPFERVDPTASGSQEEKKAPIKPTKSILEESSSSKLPTGKSQRKFMDSVSNKSSVDTQVSDKLQINKPSLDETTQEARETAEQKVMDWLETAYIGPEFTKEAIEKQRKELDLAMRKMAPHSTTLYASILAREIVGKHKDWLNKLQNEGGIKVNERVLWVMGELILEEKGSHRALDYYRAISNFNETLDKFENKDVNVPKIEAECLQGGDRRGVCSMYNPYDHENYGRYVHIKNPFTGETHFLYSGQTTWEIAEVLNKIVEGHLRFSYDAQYIAYIRHNYSVTVNQVADQLTTPVLQQEWAEYCAEREEQTFRNDWFERTIKSWKCSVAYHRQQSRTYRLDDGTEFFAVDLIYYTLPNAQEDDAFCAGIQHTYVGPPKWINCFGDVLLPSDDKTWLFESNPGDSGIDKILSNYTRINHENAVFRDIVRYENDNGETTHLATVSHRDTNDNIWGKSKLDKFREMIHPILDPVMTARYGRRVTIYTHPQGDRRPFFETHLPRPDATNTDNGQDMYSGQGTTNSYNWNFF